MTASLIAELGRDLARVVGLLHKLAKGQYYGSVTLKFEQGRVTLIRTEQSIKPDEIEAADLRLVR